MPKYKSKTSDVRNELANLAKRKLEIAESLGNLERQIYAFEGSYLKDTLLSGNVIIGWNNFINSSKKIPKRNKKNGLKKKINEADRIFSKSSITSMAAVKGIEEAQVKDEINSETETAYSGSDDIGNKCGKSNSQETPTSPPASAKRSSSTKKYKLKAKKR